MSLTRFGVSQSVVIAIGLLCLLLQWQETLATEYVVGDDKGWDLYPELVNWPKGKHFKAGDVLIFNYNDPIFSVEAVDQAQYQRCYSNHSPIKTYSSGHDHVVLAKGWNYFISGVTDYCGYGMRIAVYAE